MIYRQISNATYLAIGDSSQTNPAPVVTKHYVLPILWPELDGPAYHAPSYLTLVAKSIPMALLYTCFQVYSEAKPVPDPLFRKLAEESNRIIVDYGAMPTFACIGGVFEYISAYDHLSYTQPFTLWTEYYGTRKYAPYLNEAAEDNSKKFIKTCVQWMACPDLEDLDYWNLTHVKRYRRTVIAFDSHGQDLESPSYPHGSRQTKLIKFFTQQVNDRIFATYNGNRKVSWTLEPEGEWGPQDGLFQRLHEDLQLGSQLAGHITNFSVVVQR